MKKTLVALAIAVCMSAPGFTAGPIARTVSVTLGIAQLFDLSLSRITIPFGNAAPGTETTPEAVTCIIASNIGSVWHVSINAAPLTHTDGTTIIPPADFQYFHTFNNPDGTEIPAVGIAAPVPASLTTVFTAGPGIFNANTTEFGLGFKVVIPQAQKSGNYSTTVNIQLVDGV